MYINFDFYEEEWFEKLREIGMEPDEAKLMARVKRKLKEDQRLIDILREGSFEKFGEWVELHCRDIYYAVSGVLKAAWNWLKGLF